MRKFIAAAAFGLAATVTQAYASDLSAPRPVVKSPQVEVETYDRFTFRVKGALLAPTGRTEFTDRFGFLSQLGLSAGPRQRDSRR